MTGNQPVDPGDEDEAIRKNETTNAEQVWRERLSNGVILPTGSRAVIAVSDLYHVIVDSRIRRKPERIEFMLRGVFEIRTSKLDRQIALTRWSEEEQILVGFIILDSDNRLRSLHVVDDRRIRREQNRGTVLWRQQERTHSGPDPKTMS